MTTSTSIELENYTLGDEIGRGDLTIVYQANRKSDNTTVAVKLVPPQFTFDDIFVRRFLDMARQATRLDHPNIVKTFEAKEQGSVLFIVREYLQNRSLTDILAEEGPFSPYRTLKIAKQIAGALDYAHQKSIMHGDLSANRVYLDADDHVTVADFGQMQSMAGTSLVKTGFAVGSPEIMAPERVHGQGPSRQSDLYSLGVLCYQMLNGRPPFVGEPAAVLHAQAYEQPRPLHLANPEVSMRLSEAVGRMLSKGLELRYSTGSEFIRALTVAVEGTAPIRVTSSPTKTGAMDVELDPSPPIWQRPWVWVLMAIPLILVLLAAGFFAVSAWLAFNPATAVPDPASEAIEAVEPVEAVVPQTPTQPATTEPTATVAVIAVEPTQSSSEATEPAGNTVAATVPPPTTPTPAATPTPVSLPTPGPAVVAPDSPFTQIQLAHSIGSEDQPEKVGTSFAPGSQPIYLFFEYADIESGTPWTHRWTWGDTELDVFEDVWPDSFFDTGTAWVFYSPTGGFQPGPYQVTLEVNGQVVATAKFVVQPGGI
jgi:serine/threonine-protein kinase